MASAFGAFFKDQRIRSGVTLRQFCLDHGFDPGNISRLERGRLAPPQSEAKLTEYAKALGITEGSDEWFEFFDLAAAEKGRVPPDLLSDEEVLKKLPLLFRTLRGRKVNAEDLQALVETIRRA